MAVAGASTLQGVNGLPDRLRARDQIEDRGGVYGLTKQLRDKNPTSAYKKTVDAAVFFRSVNLIECREA
jgi:hypothetical protein